MPPTKTDTKPTAAAEWRWRKTRVMTDPSAERAAPRRRSGFLRLPRADRRHSVTITVVYKGGTESYWLVKARGEHQIFAGHLALEDVMARVLSER